jgi:hypothetical protein
MVFLVVFWFSQVSQAAAEHPLLAMELPQLLREFDLEAEQQRRCDEMLSAMAIVQDLVDRSRGSDPGSELVRKRLKAVPPLSLVWIENPKILNGHERMLDAVRRYGKRIADIEEVLIPEIRPTYTELKLLIEGENRRGLDYDNEEILKSLLILRLGDTRSVNWTDEVQGLAAILAQLVAEIAIREYRQSNRIGVVRRLIWRPQPSSRDLELQRAGIRGGLSEVLNRMRHTVFWETIRP